MNGGLNVGGKNVWWVKCMEGKMNGGQNVWWAKCIEGKMSEGKTYGGQNESGQKVGESRFQ